MSLRAVNTSREAIVTHTDRPTLRLRADVAIVGDILYDDDYEISVLDGHEMTISINKKPKFEEDDNNDQ
jgi:hypothetical protein